MIEHIAKNWPVLSGNYVVGNKESNVVIITVSSKLEFPKDFFAVCGEMRTENLGVERVIANVISNSFIRYVIVCGKESKGHFAGKSLIAIHKNGIDKDGKIIGSNGAIPYIHNIPREAVSRFQKQIIKVIDLIDETDLNKIINVIKSLPKVDPFEKDCYVIKAVKKAKSKIHAVIGDVAIFDGIHLDPISFTICE